MTSKDRRSSRTVKVLRVGFPSTKPAAVTLREYTVLDWALEVYDWIDEGERDRVMRIVGNADVKGKGFDSLPADVTRLLEAAERRKKRKKRQ